VGNAPISANLRHNNFRIARYLLAKVE
jgi:hypothetical protein